METRPDRIKAPVEMEHLVCQVKPRMCNSVRSLSSDLKTLRVAGTGNGKLEEIRQRFSMLIQDCQTANQRKDDCGLPCVQQRQNIARMMQDKKR